QGLEAIARFRGVESHTLSGAVVDSDKDADLALLRGYGRGHVGAPEFVRSIGDDRAGMGLRAVGMSDPLRCLQAVLAHQAPDPLLRGPHAQVTQPGPDLAVALAVERRLAQDMADVADEFLVRAGAERPAPLEFRPLPDGDGPLMPLVIERRAGQVPGA